MPRYEREFQSTPHSTDDTRRNTRAHRVGDFAQRRPIAHRIDNRRHQIALRRAPSLHLRQRSASAAFCIALGADAREPRALFFLNRGIDLQDIARRFGRRGKFVDPDDDPLLELRFRADR